MNEKNAIRYIVQSWNTRSPRTGRFAEFCRITRTEDGRSVYLACGADNAAYYAKLLAEQEGGKYGYPSVFQCDTVTLRVRDFDRRYNSLRNANMFRNLDAYAEDGLKYDEWAAKELRAELDKAKEKEA